MITGIIFACVIGKDICALKTQEFDTVQECIVGTTDAIKSLGDTPGVVLYTLCNPEGEPA